MWQSLGRAQQQRGPEDVAAGALAQGPDLDREQLARMVGAGRDVLAWRHILAKSNDNVVGEILRHESAFYVLDHYPKGDVYDRDTHAQWYYHAHDKHERPGEHGHFHTFLRGAGMPDGLGERPKCAPNDLVCHLIAISMDRSGWPIKLFTTNRWVTGETWYPAPEVCRMLDHFDVRLARPSWIVNRWLSSMLALYRPEIERLLLARDAKIEAWQVEHRGDTNNPHEDRRLEVTSELEIDVEARVQELERQLGTA